MGGMGKRRLILSIALLVVATLLFVFLQSLLLMRAYALEKRTFSASTQEYLSEVFFQVRRWDERILAFSHENLAGPALPAPGDSRLREKLRQALAEYGQLGDRLRRRYATAGLTLDFEWEVSVSRFVLYRPGGGQAVWVDGRGAGLLLFGGLRDPAHPDLRSRFSLIHPDYFVEVAVTLRHVALRRFLLGRMAGLSIASLLAMGAVFAIFAFTAMTLLRQKRLADMKNDFIANVSHELKTPLGTCAVALKVLRERPAGGSTPEGLAMVGVVERQVARLNGLVERVVALTVHDDPGLELDLRRVTLHPILRRVFEDFRVQSAGRAPRLAIELNAGRDLVALDEFHFTTALGNLLDNALKYSPDPADIRLSCTEAGDELVVAVADRGVGIASREQGRIFEKFYRVATGYVHQAKGLGLGLYAARAIARAHGGRIECQSAPGRGSTFRIVLPMAR